MNPCCLKEFVLSEKLVNENWLFTFSYCFCNFLDIEVEGEFPNDDPETMLE